MKKDEPQFDSDCEISNSILWTLGAGILIYFAMTFVNESVGVVQPPANNQSTQPTSP